MPLFKACPTFGTRQGIAGTFLQNHNIQGRVAQGIEKQPGVIRKVDADQRHKLAAGNILRSGFSLVICLPGCNGILTDKCFGCRNCYYYPSLVGCIYLLNSSIPMSECIFFCSISPLEPLEVPSLKSIRLFPAAMDWDKTQACL